MYPAAHIRNIMQPTSAWCIRRLSMPCVRRQDPAQAPPHETPACMSAALSAFPVTPMHHSKRSCSSRQTIGPEYAVALQAVLHNMPHMSLPVLQMQNRTCRALRAARTIFAIFSVFPIHSVFAGVTSSTCITATPCCETLNTFMLQHIGECRYPLSADKARKQLRKCDCACERQGIARWALLRCLSCQVCIGTTAARRCCCVWAAVTAVSCCRDVRQVPACNTHVVVGDVR